MATGKSLEPGRKLSWAGKLVCLDQIERELLSLWHLAADNMRISQNMNVRTSVLNFIICAPNPASAKRASTLLRGLSSTHIARVILVILDAQSNYPPDISTWITLRSFPIISDIMRHTFEQITALFTANAIYDAANLVHSLLKPDLPVYLWWVDDLPTDLSIFCQILTNNKRVIVDSNEFIAPEERIQQLSQFLQVTPDCALSDLNWGRITPWRELIAQFFDVADYRPYLVNINSIEIEHAVLPLSEAPSPQDTSISSNPIPALLLATWLQTRLGWLISNNDTTLVRNTQTGIYRWHLTNRKPSPTTATSLITTLPDRLARTSKDYITITVQPRIQSGLLPGTICLVRLTSQKDDSLAIFSINRGDDEQYVVTSVQIPGYNHPQRTVNIAATHKENEMLHDELEITGRDYLYERSLHEVSSLLKH
jgi:glucose-6-phosphate dehydrogenase assembly protein OpcA